MPLPPRLPAARADRFSRARSARGFPRPPRRPRAARCDIAPGRWVGNVSDLGGMDVRRPPPGSARRLLRGSFEKRDKPDFQPAPPPGGRPAPRATEDRAAPASTAEICSTAVSSVANLSKGFLDRRSPPQAASAAPWAARDAPWRRRGRRDEHPAIDAVGDHPGLDNRRGEHRLLHLVHEPLGRRRNAQPAALRKSPACGANSPPRRPWRCRGRGLRPDTPRSRSATAGNRKSAAVPAEQPRVVQSKQDGNLTQSQGSARRSK